MFSTLHCYIGRREGRDNKDRTMNNNAPNDDDNDYNNSSVETVQINSFADFCRRNINHGNDENAVLGLSLLRVVRRDPGIRSLTVTNECAGCIEYAGYEVDLYRDTLTDEQIELLESFGFEVDDYTENAPVIGTHIANLPNLRTIILEGARSCLRDSEYRYMFEEASGSTSIRTLIFRRCRLDHHIDLTTEVLIAILCTEAVQEVTFENCTFDTTFMEALNEVADENIWSVLRFEQCRFRHNVMHHIIAQNDDIKMTGILIFHQCKSISANGQALDIPWYDA